MWSSPKSLFFTAHLGASPASPAAPGEKRGNSPKMLWGFFFGGGGEGRVGRNGWGGVGDSEMTSHIVVLNLGGKNKVHTLVYFQS